MISHEHKCIFIHIPRTGGSSMEMDICGFDYGKKDEKLLYEKHLTVKDSINLYGKDIWDNYFTFTFIRNPWDRVLSLYLFKIDTNLIVDRGFKHFLENYEVSPWEQTPDTYENILEIPDGAKPIDFIGRFENLQEDFQQLSKKIGLDKYKLTDGYNKTYHNHYSNYYDGESKKKIYDLYKKDIEFFNYIF